jgi:hypothetical protein
MLLFQLLMMQRQSFHFLLSMWSVLIGSTSLHEQMLHSKNSAEYICKMLCFRIICMDLKTSIEINIVVFTNPQGMSHTILVYRGDKFIVTSWHKSTLHWTEMLMIVNWTWILVYSIFPSKSIFSLQSLKITYIQLIHFV